MSSSGEAANSESAATAVERATAKRYKQLQMVCITAAVVHGIALLLCIYSFREGNLDEFSIARLMRFVTAHVVLWRACGVTVSLSSITFLLQFLAFRQVLRARHELWMLLATSVIVIAIAGDLHAHGTMMVLFADIANQIHSGGFYSNQDLLLQGWIALSQAMTQTFLYSNTLYTFAGFILAAAIVRGGGPPRWLGWAAFPVWITSFLVSLLTFVGEIPWAIVLLFASVIAFTVWSIVVAVTIDPLTAVSEPDESEHQPS